MGNIARNKDEVLSKAVKELAKGFVNILKNKEFRKEVSEGEMTRDDFVMQLCELSFSEFQKVFNNATIYNPDNPDDFSNNISSPINEEHEAFLKKISGELFDDIKKNIDQNWLSKCLSIFLNKLVNLFTRDNKSRTEKIVDKVMKSIEKEIKKPKEEIKNPDLKAGDLKRER